MKKSNAGMVQKKFQHVFPKMEFIKVSDLMSSHEFHKLEKREMTHCRIVGVAIFVLAFAIILIKEALKNISESDSFNTTREATTFLKHARQRIEVATMKHLKSVDVSAMVLTQL